MVIAAPMMKPETINHTAAEPKPEKMRSGRARPKIRTSPKKIRLVRKGGSAPVLQSASVTSTTAALRAARGFAAASGPSASQSATMSAMPMSRCRMEKEVFIGF